MPEVEREFEVDAPMDDTWDYLTDMENFSSHLPGFQEYEEVDETTSLWTVKFDLSMFSKEMTFEVEVTEEDKPDAAFELEPQNEPGSGTGTVNFEENGDATTVTFVLEAEASGRTAPFLNQVIGKALPRVSDGIIEDIHGSDLDLESDGED